MSSLLIFGKGYCGTRIADALAARGWSVAWTARDAAPGAIAFDDQHALAKAIGEATHILSTIPPGDEGDPVLQRHAAAIAAARPRWIGYLSSTGVYGDTGGAWVDERALPAPGRRSARVAADAAWQALGDAVRVFRLPGIYGPGRSPLDRVAAGQAHRIDMPGQVFSRIHVDDIVAGVVASLSGPPGIYNLADDRPAPQHEVIAYACRLLGRAPPPMQSPDEAGLSPAARGFYAENRRVANAKAKRLLGWAPLYPDYRAGLRALNAMTSPTSASTHPVIASGDQR